MLVDNIIKEKDLYDSITILNERDITPKIQIEQHSEYDFFDINDDGFRIYHSDGYVFEVKKEKSFRTEEDEDNNIFYWEYTFDNYQYDGFKYLDIDKALEIVKVSLDPRWL